MTANPQWSAKQNFAHRSVTDDQEDDLRLLRREVRELEGFGAELSELRERRISAIEEVLAVPWPQRWLLAWRFRRGLRASVRECAWAGESWHDRRAQAMSEEHYGIRAPRDR